MALPIKQRWLEATLAERLAAIGAALQAELTLLPPITPELLDREPPFENTSWN
jgi:hypothetical protein